MHKRSLCGGLQQHACPPPCATACLAVALQFKRQGEPATCPQPSWGRWQRRWWAWHSSQTSRRCCATSSRKSSQGAYQRQAGSSGSSSGESGGGTCSPAAASADIPGPRSGELWKFGVCNANSLSACGIRGWLWCQEARALDVNAMDERRHLFPMLPSATAHGKLGIHSMHTTIIV